MTAGGTQGQGGGELGKGPIGKTVSFEGATITGIVAAVPKRIVGNDAFRAHFSETEIADITKMTGVKARRRAAPDVTAGDLCYHAAKQLIARLGWTRDSVDALIFVSQTPDYRLPATSCVLQRRLELAPYCAAFDVNLGCSGYVYGLWLATQLTALGGFRRVLLLVGDTISKVVNDTDRTTAFLFGDAGSATAVEATPGAPRLTFVLGTDGGGEKNLIIPEGGFRLPSAPLVEACTLQNGQPVRAASELYMNGGEIFNFTLQTVSPLVQETLRQSSVTAEEVDAFVFHQANAFMLRHLAKKAKLPPEKVPMNIERYGNTSCTSIPLVLADDLASSLASSSRRLCLVGFGVGYSWASAMINVGPLRAAEVVEV